MTEAYDCAGRLTQQTDTTNTATVVNGDKLPAVTIVKTQAYDVRDNRTSLTITRNGVTDLTETFKPDSMNRLQYVYDNGVLQATYGYDLNGNRLSLAYANGVTTSYVYNNANLVTSLTNKLGSAVISSYTYTYKLDGNQASKKDNMGINTAYVYDDLGRLTNETEITPVGVRGATAETTISKSYTSFDKANNRLSMTMSTKVGTAAATGYTTSYTYNSANQLLTEKQTPTSGAVITTSYQYDANGNQTSKSGNGQTLSYVYDVYNRLAQMNAGSTVVTYRYKADGLRVAINNKLNTSSSQTTIHVWDGNNIALELNSTGNITNKYIRGINLIKTIPLSGSTNERYFLFNAHGDVTQLTDSSGTVKKNYYYDSFGVEINLDSSDTNPWRYGGEYFDQTSGGTTSLSTSVSDLCYSEYYQYWPLIRDHSINGNTIKLNGVTYSKGLGAHANSTVTIPLSGIYTTFYSVIGIDDEVSTIGDAIFKVIADGVEIYNSGSMKPGMVKTVSLNVSGKQTLQLMTDTNGDYMNDHTDWANARLTGTDGVVTYVSDWGYTQTTNYRSVLCNVSAAFKTLTLAGKQYVKGLCAYTNSTITVPLKGSYDRFVADIGPDSNNDSTPVNMIFKVLADGVELYNSGSMTAGTVKTVDIIITGKQNLQLVIQNNGGNGYCYGDWADAKLIRNGSAVTGMYYLRARYYDPANSRMLSEDSSRNGLNYYTYCRNNPLFYWDPTGLKEVALRDAIKEYYGSDAELKWDAETKTASIYGAKFSAAIGNAYINSKGVMIIDDKIFSKNPLPEPGLDYHPVRDGVVAGIAIGTVIAGPGVVGAVVDAVGPEVSATIGTVAAPIINKASNVLDKVKEFLDDESGAIEMDLNFFGKKDLKMVNDAANEVGVDRNAFGEYIHELKDELGMKASQNFTYQELLEHARDLKNAMEKWGN